MIKHLVAVAALVTLALPAAFAADKPEAKKLTPQQQRMANCNKEAKAKALKGDARKKFMSACLKKK